MKIDSKVSLALFVLLTSACAHHKSAPPGSSASRVTDVRINPGIPPEFWSTAAPVASAEVSSEKSSRYSPLKAGQLLYIPASEKALKSADLRGPTAREAKNVARKSTKGRREALYTEYRQLSWPVDGKVGSVFGLRNGRPHAGIDILSDSGEPITAAHAGRVEFVGWKRGYGKTLVIRHEGFRTLYAHCSKILAKEGELVAKGEKVAIVGNSGNAEGIHLHFEYHTLAGKALDPMPHFSRALAH